MDCTTRYTVYDIQFHRANKNLAVICSILYTIDKRIEGALLYEVPFQESRGKRHRTPDPIIRGKRLR